jgi:molecular chaperone GrpE
MEMNEKEQEKEKPFDELSQDELLNRIDADALTDNHEEMKEDKQEENELQNKFGFPKKDKLKKENDELKQQLAEADDKYLRLFADFDNFRKRNQKERIELIKIAGMDVITSLLPVLDDFQRALRQMEAMQDPMTEGVILIYQKLLSTLEAKGLKAMKSVGENFNPELHEAISEIPVPDESMKGKVVDEIEPGYYLNDKIIRHAKVVVGN